MPKANPHPPFPTSKLPPSNRIPIYQSHPNPHPNSHRLPSCFCSTILTLLSLIFLISLASGIFYAIYRPHTPIFSISSLHISAPNSPSILNITASARNPNRRIVFSYDQISISISSNGVGFGNGFLPGFVHGAKNTTALRSPVSVKSDFRKSVNPFEIEMEMKARIEIGSLKTKRFGMKVYCNGIKIVEEKGKKGEIDSTVGWGCRVQILRMKIWKWTV